MDGNAETLTLCILQRDLKGRDDMARGSIARSFGADNIVAIAIAPGWVRTEMAREFVSRFGEAVAVADIPIGRMAEPSEIAELVSFALRSSQRSLSGATLDVNGASYIR